MGKIEAKVMWMRDLKGKSKRNVRKFKYNKDLFVHMTWTECRQLLGARVEREWGSM